MCAGAVSRGCASVVVRLFVESDCAGIGVGRPNKIQLPDNGMLLISPCRAVCVLCRFAAVGTGFDFGTSDPIGDQGPAAGSQGRVLPN